MRFPSFPNIVRTLYTLSNATAHRLLQQPLRGTTTSTSSQVHRGVGATVLRSMPSIPFLGALFGTSASTPAAAKMTYPDTRSDDEWRAVLNKEQFRILREKGTEAPFTGEYDKHMPSQGVYTCAACSAPLYKADHKFKSGCGWPAYFDSIPGAVTRHTDRSFGMERTEIVCSNCGGHLGHVFKGEGYPTPTDERHCVNSVSLKFHEKESEANGNGEAK
ncbi:methionine-R-sulfoxide reductase [Cladophialophora carrionii CBS 160.54]|uniref:Peptide-methionine (R)-S-oxide reductase n=1 Tax=Cladophialophora carrionii CBS 160.54 TaxID=1279043 RepID=V9DM28_9EURO|nr:methionine-R-sulfoxide reductase [Cladophialophora carrionii CBS 160.54]ETI27721.1 methionine-R-sulfoxide reductase [Cladophialophora carrionii CBS 160.54]